MKINVKIGSKISDKQRAISLNDEVSHHVQDNELQKILDIARKNAWKNKHSAGKELGADLFKLLDRSSGKFSSLIKDAFNIDEQLYLYFDIPFEIDAIPFELLFDEQF